MSKLHEVIRASAGEPVQLIYQRDGKQSTVQVKPSYSTADGTGRWMIGVQLERPIMITKLGLGEALRESVDQKSRAHH